MDETELFEWLQKERSSADLAMVPADAYKQLVMMFKTIKSDEHALKNLGECFTQIYGLRERKIVEDTKAKAAGYQTIIANLLPEEAKLQQELLHVLTEGRLAIFPFLYLPHAYNQKPEFK